VIRPTTIRVGFHPQGASQSQILRERLRAQDILRQKKGVVRQIIEQGMAATREAIARTKAMATRPVRKALGARIDHRA